MQQQQDAVTAGVDFSCRKNEFYNVVNDILHRLGAGQSRRYFTFNSGIVSFAVRVVYERKAEERPII
jgi:hypothetical protein